MPEPEVPEDALHPVITAHAEQHPCAVYAYHRPVPTRTQFHHSKPVYLQNRLWGKILYGPDLWVCGTCHDSIHAWLAWLLGEASKPAPEPGWRIKRVAQAVAEWYWHNHETFT